MTTVSAYIINPAFLRLMCCLLNFLIAFCTLSCFCLPSGPFQATTFLDCMATSLRVSSPLDTGSHKSAASGHCTARELHVTNSHARREGGARVPASATIW